MKKVCPICQGEFEAVRANATVCKKAKCIKAAQRAKKSSEKGEAPSTTDQTKVPLGPDAPSVSDPVVMVDATLGYQWASDRDEKAQRIRKIRSKSTSPTVALKQRTKARILAKKGKSGGPSIPLPASSDASDSDVPLAVRAGLEKLRGHARDLVKEGVVSQKMADAAVKMVLNTFTQLPVENHGKTNDLARQSILSKVPVHKGDPNSDAATLARLNACQLKKPAKGKEGA